MATSMINAMCRCCASEGVFKDVKSTYHWMGDEEIYADMLKECFDVSLFIPEEGAEGGEGGICEVCITQLRNAVNFKKQVLHTEEQFKRHVQNKLFKPNIVKVEVEPDDDNDSDDNNASAEEGYSGAEYEIPIKKEVPEEPKPKKRAAAVKASTSRAKKAKTEIGEPSTKRTGCETAIKLEPGVRKLTSKALHDWTVTIKKTCPKKELLNKTHYREIDMHLHNIRTILLNSNATPIRSHDGFGYACCFCKDQYTNASELKTHSLDKHGSKSIQKFMHGTYLSHFLVKLDITNLHCKICNKSIDTLQELQDHLSNQHDKKTFSEIKNYIVPFKFDNDAFKCVICPMTFEHYKLVQEHMNVHYKNYVCKICSASFITKRTLGSHMARHKRGEFTCTFCPKVFDSQTKKSIHEKCVHITDNKRHKCPMCDDKFVSYHDKKDHMVKVHGTQPLILKCRACDKTFTRRDRLTKHIKRDHLMERKYECAHCDMKFYEKKTLTTHMLKHTGIKEHKCEFCLKAFGRMNTLKEHLRIHADDRRFKCEHCGQAFVQKCSWKSHMRSKHGECV